MVTQSKQVTSPEQILEVPHKKHWVRLATACNHKCIFCLDSDTPRGIIVPTEEVKAEIDRGIDELGANRLILSGGEASLHPDFPELIRYGKERGYDRVQTITNGHRLADRDFMKACLDAGLEEITFSLHGHTEELHDHLTQAPSAFRHIVKAISRAVRDGRPIVNIDVCLNKQNIAHIEELVALGISLGVGEFDLLHVIPQAAAFDNRDKLFYDVREHLPALQRVLKLNKHPRFHIWTNRLPVPHLEGFEEYIQDPKKIGDEVNGRRWHMRAYLDLGTPLECRQPERCVHCYVEPFCTTMDRVVEGMNEETWEVWWIGDEPISATTVPVPLPYGCDRLGMRVERLADLADADLPAGVGLYLQVEEPAPLADAVPAARPLTLVAESDAHLRAWLGEAALPAGVEIEILLNASTARWMIAERDRLGTRLDSIRLTQPGFKTVEETRAQEITDLPGFFRALDLPIRTAGLPACLAPGTVLEEPVRRLERSLFDPELGRPDLQALSRYHIVDHYYDKSARCADCAVNARCRGAHINTIRHQRLRILQPLEGEWAGEAKRQLEARWPEPPDRLNTGRPPQPPAPSLPGFERPTQVAQDPLANLVGRRGRGKRVIVDLEV